MSAGKHKTLRVRYWVDINGKKFFGPGRAELLKLIEETGSISKAASAMKMSYKKAWAMVKEMNSKGSKPYVIMQKGGEQGGGAVVTPAGHKVLKAYLRLNQNLASIAGKEKDLLKLI